MLQFWKVFPAISLGLPMLASASVRPAPNAFLDFPVDTTGQLVRQVQTDGAVRDRYLRHFGMTQSELSAYLWTLRPTRLADAQTVSVYSVPQSGAVKLHQQKLRKGERVFVDPDGKPALLVQCGNPLSEGPANKLNASMVMPSLDDNAVLAFQPIPVETGPLMVVPPPTAVAMIEPPDTIADVITEPETTTTIVPAPTPTPEPAVVPPAPPVAVGGGGRGGFGLFPLLGAGALLGLLGSHHGDNPPPVAAVPEPVGALLFGAATVALIARRKRLH